MYLVLRRQVVGGVVLWSTLALAFAGLLLAGWATGQGSLSGLPILTGRAVLSGRIPGGGRPFTVGAVHDGKVVRKGTILPGGHFTLRVPPGNYQVGLWIPGQRPSASFLACTTQTTVRDGRTTVVNLYCVWH